MTEINFYHLSTTNIENALPKLLEKVLSVGAKALLLCQNENFVKTIDEILWSVGGTRFIPHGTDKDEFKEQQPVFVTQTMDNINNADILVATYPLDNEFIFNFKKPLIFFNSNDNQELNQARNLWKKLKQNSESKLKYYIQDEKGTWSEKQI